MGTEKLMKLTLACSVLSACLSAGALYFAMQASRDAVDAYSAAEAASENSEWAQAAASDAATAAQSASESADMAADSCN